MAPEQLMRNMLLVYAHNPFPSGVEKQNLAFCWGDADTYRCKDDAITFAVDDHQRCSRYLKDIKKVNRWIGRQATIVHLKSVKKWRKIVVGG